MAKEHIEISYSKELAEQICNRVAEGESLSAICGSAGMPDKATLRRWQAEKEDFPAMLEAARQHQADTHFESILRIANDLPEPPGDGSSAEVSAYRAYLAAASLRADTLKWAAARLAPGRYSERGARRAEEQAADSMGELVARIRATDTAALAERSGPPPGA